LTGGASDIAFRAEVSRFGLTRWQRTVEVLLKLQRCISLSLVIAYLNASVREARDKFGRPKTSSSNAQLPSSSSPNLVPDEEATARLQAEAQMAAALAHPNIATVYELVSRRSALHRYGIRRWRNSQIKIQRDPIDLNEALEIGTEVGEALELLTLGIASLRSQELEHNDHPEWTDQVLDFGLARVPPVTVQSAPQDGFNTQVGSAELSDKKCAGSPRDLRHPR